MRYSKDDEGQMPFEKSTESRRAVKAGVFSKSRAGPEFPATSGGVSRVKG
jgi:hypothetical protein